MKALYEIVNGSIGFSYVRVYVWADNEGQALKLAQSRFQEKYPNDSERWENLEIQFLFKADSQDFVTSPSDEGFGMEKD